VKFLIDMPLSPALAAWLREQRHDAVHAAELGLNRSPDVDILARAKLEGRSSPPTSTIHAYWRLPTKLIPG
jgi:predicted nuclease of predicted toxin-antitoxin system